MFKVKSNLLSSHKLNSKNFQPPTQNPLQMSHQPLQSDILTLTTALEKVLPRLGYQEDGVTNILNLILSNRPLFEFKLQRDIQIHIISLLPLSSVYNLCLTNTYFKKLCDDDSLWRKLVLTKFPEQRQLETSWRRTMEAKFRIVEPMVELMGLTEFLNTFIPMLLPYMTIVPEIADQYRLPLTDLDIQIVQLEDDKDEVKAVFDDYIEHREQDCAYPNPFEMYTFDFDKPYPDKKLKYSRNNLKRLLDNFVHQLDFARHIDPQQVDPHQIRDLTARLYKPETFERFLNEPVPKLRNLTVHNPSGVYYNYKSLITTYEDGSRRDPEPGSTGLNILETGEQFSVTYPSEQITLLDVLMLVMSTKSAKEEFICEIVQGVKEFTVKGGESDGNGESDEVEQMLVLDVLHI